MAIKDRNQNLVVGDTVRLRIFSINANQYTNLKLIDAINVYYLDPTAVTDINPDGRTLFQSLDVGQIVQDDIGQYHIDLPLVDPQFVIGNYLDIWDVIFCDSSNCESKIENKFTVFPNLWIVTSKPLVYDFSFKFFPNRITQGSIKYITVNITPDVLKKSELEQYYANLLAAANITISVVQRCGNCLPVEEDLRVVIDGDPMTFKDGNTGYYLLDTTELDCGIYDVFFTLTFGNTVIISPKGQLEIFN